jgi:hypothetical protein
MLPWSVILIRVILSRRPVHRLRGPGAEQAVLALAADAADVVVAFAHLGDQLADFLGRVLQVGIQGDDDVAAAVFEAGHDGHVLAGVGAEQDDAGDIRAASNCSRRIAAERSRLPSLTKTTS